jgi:hypothetical protein
MGSARHCASIVLPGFEKPVLDSACLKCSKSFFSLFLRQLANLAFFFFVVSPALLKLLVLLNQTFFRHSFSRRYRVGSPASGEEANA